MIPQFSPSPQTRQSGRTALLTVGVLRSIDQVRTFKHKNTASPLVSSVIDSPSGGADIVTGLCHLAWLSTELNVKWTAETLTLNAIQIKYSKPA